MGAFGHPTGVANAQLLGFRFCLFEGLAVTFLASVLTDSIGNWNQNN